MDRGRRYSGRRGGGMRGGKNPHSHAKREDCWFKIMVPYGSGISESELFALIRPEMTELSMQFNPISVKYFL